VIAALMTAPEIEIIDTWTTTGLRGSGSNDVACHGVFVPADRVVPLPLVPRRSETLYRYPTALGINFTGVPLGIVRAAVAAIKELVGRKRSFMTREAAADQPDVLIALAKAEALVESSRAYVYDTVRTLWADLEAERTPSLETRAAWRLAQLHAYHRCMEAV